MTHALDVLVNGSYVHMLYSNQNQILGKIYTKMCHLKTVFS